MMNNDQKTFNPYGFVPEEEKPASLQEIWQRYSYHWPLFLLCLLISFVIAFLYVNKLNPVYHVRAKLSIQDDEKSAKDPFALQELNLTGMPKSVESELEVIKSRPLIGQVVNDLELYVQYAYSDRYKTKDLYEDTPIKFHWLKRGIMPKRLYEITIEDHDHFILRKADGDTLRVAFREELSSDFGLWKLDTTVYLDQFIGKTVQLSFRPFEESIDAYQNQIMAQQNKVAPIIELSLDDEIAERGTAIVNHLIEVYKDFNVLDKNKETEKTLQFIDERLASLTGELTNVEKDVEGYKSSVGLTDISEKSQYYLNNVQSNDAQLNEVNVQLNVIEGIEAYIQSPGHSSAVPATIGITDPGLVSLVQQLAELQIQRERLLAITPEGNPIFTPINKQINSTKAAIQETVQGIKTSLLATKRQLEKNNNRFESSIKSLPGQERQYVSIKRQQGIKENLYIYLLQKREEVALSYASTVTNARTIEQAYYGAPTKERGLPFALALLIGGVFPAGFIRFRERIKNRILTRSDIEAVTQAPVICELIQAKKDAKIVVLDDQRFAIGEQLRALRTNLLQAHRHNKGKVTLFTSSIAGEGKSFVASNIGAALAASGKKTIILELDLRRPRISKILELNSSAAGLTELLEGKVGKDEIRLPSNLHENLSVMPAGTILHNPSELLESEQMRALIEELRLEYDHILIDSPPLHLVTDALILAPLADVSLYVLRHDYTPKTELKFIEEVFKSGKLPQMKIVFNGVQMDKRFGYSLDYRYYSDRVPGRSFLFSIFGNFFSRF